MLVKITKGRAALTKRWGTRRKILLPPLTAPEFAYYAAYEQARYHYRRAELSSNGSVVAAILGILFGLMVNYLANSIVSAILNAWLLWWALLQPIKILRTLFPEQAERLVVYHCVTYFDEHRDIYNYTTGLAHMTVVLPQDAC